MFGTGFAAHRWGREKTRQQAAAGFRALETWGEHDAGAGLPPMPDSFPEAAAAALCLKRRFNVLAGDEASAQAARGRLEGMLNSLSEGVVSIDSSERILFSNPASRKLLGLAENTPIGRQLAEVVRSTSLQQAVMECRQRRHPALCELRLGERSERVLNAHCAPLPPEQGGVVILLTDITFHSRTEEFRRDFVSNVSHELRTPVTSIQGYAETLLDTPDLNEKTRQRFLEVISRQAVRLNHIIEDILELSRLEHDASGFVFEPAPLYPILQSSLETCSARAMEKSIPLTFNAPQALVAEVNASLLEQALTNLISNAIKYSPDGKPVRITAVGDGSGIRISVEDNGIGIPPEHLPRLFERFYRVDKARSRSVGGTGLGLAIVRQVALLHLGQVSVRSVLGAGSVFTLELPFKRPVDQ